MVRESNPRSLSADLGLATRRIATLPTIQVEPTEYRHAGQYSYAHQEEGGGVEPLDFHPHGFQDRCPATQASPSIAIGAAQARVPASSATLLRPYGSTEPSAQTDERQPRQDPRPSTTLVPRKWTEGFEPSAPRLEVWCSARLSYAHMTRRQGIEPR